MVYCTIYRRTHTFRRMRTTFYLFRQTLTRTELSFEALLTRACISFAYIIIHIPAFIYLSVWLHERDRQRSRAYAITFVNWNMCGRFNQYFNRINYLQSIVDRFISHLPYGICSLHHHHHHNHIVAMNDINVIYSSHRIVLHSYLFYANKNNSKKFGFSFIIVLRIIGAINNIIAAAVVVFVTSLIGM